MKSRLRKVFRWLGIVLGVLLLLLAIFLVEEHIRGRRALNRWMAEMRAKGEKFSIAELTPAPVPPEKNGAGLFLGTGFGGKVVSENLPGATRYVAAGKAVPMIDYPAWTIRKKGELFFDTNGVTALWRTNTGLETPIIGGRHLPMLITKQDLAADIAAASNSFEQVFAALSYSQWDFGIGYEQGFANLLLPHLSKVKAPAQWMRAASLSALYETDLEASLENLLGIAKLSHVSTNEPLMISQFVRLAVFQIGVSAVWEALQADGWKEKQLAELQAAYGSMDAMRSMGRALEMERAMGVQMIDRSDDRRSLLKSSEILDVEFTLSQISVPTSFDELFDPIVDTFKSLVPLFNRFIYLPVWDLAWKDQDKLRLLLYWQRCIDAARSQAIRPDWSRAAMPGDGDYIQRWAMGGEMTERPGPFYDRIRYLISPVLAGTGESALRRAVRANMASELVVTALALRRFELAQGRLPETLSELVPRFLARVPLDSFDGKPLRYRREADGTFLLYSVGANGRDDGGNAAGETPQSRPQFLNDLDIVWPQAATPEEVFKVDDR